MSDLSSRNELSGLSDTLRPVTARAAELRIAWLLIGAAARDLILGHLRGMPASRATLDVDVAIQVETWEEYGALRKSLVEKDGARAHPRKRQRLVFPGGDQIDLVPFGSIEEHGEIAWPPDSNPVLSVRGLREAYQQSMRVVLPGPLEIRVPSLESHLCLKLFAWHERHRRKPKHDSADLADFLRSADRMIELEVLYEEYEPVLRENGYDPARAVLQILGKQLKGTLLRETRCALVTILHGEIDEDGKLELLRELGPGPEWLPSLRALLRGLS
jgi:predicted nucleotidyltransferase